jgi:hypothetical protein
MDISQKVTVSFNVKDNYVIATYDGKFSVNDALEAFDYVLNHNDHVRGMNRIWEISNAKFEVENNEEIELVARYTEIFPPVVRDVKEAMVSKINSNWVKLKLFKMYSKEILKQVDIFENLQDAIDWVTSD